MSQLLFGESFGQNKETPQPPSYQGRVLSYSSVHLYQTCPQKWKFKYIDKVPERPRSFFSFGKSVHGGLEYLFSNLEGDLPPLEEVLSFYQSHWLREGYESPEQEKWYYQEGGRILRGFYAKHRQDVERVFKVEYKFTVHIEGIPVTGFIDRIDRTPQHKLAIIDYKTGKAFDRSRVRKDPQLTLYQIALKNDFAQEVETVTLYHLNSLTPLTVPAHSAALEAAIKKKVVDCAGGITQNKFDPKPEASGHCQWCDYVQICPAFSGKKLPLSLKYSQKESVEEMVDRYGQLERKIQELAKERESVGRTLLARSKSEQSEELRGKRFRVYVRQNGNPAQPDIRAEENKEENKKDESP